jgi:TolB-like protein
MKKLLVICLLCCGPVLFQGQSQAAYQKTTIAVLDFVLQGAGYETEDMGKIVAEWLTTALVKVGRFRVIERRLLQQILGEQKLVMTGVVDQAVAAELGKLHGVKVIISGTVIRTANLIEVNARIIDLESASIVAAESITSDSTARLELLIADLAAKIIKDFPLEGYLIYRQSDQVKIDLGHRAGVQPGMTFVVFKEGNAIKHPVTGEVLDVERVETGYIVIDEVSTKYSSGHVLSEVADEAVKYGQLVKSHSKPVAQKTQRLFVNTSPEDAQVRILNIREKYQPGIELPPGRYLLEISAPGYTLKKEWAAVVAQQDTVIHIALQAAESRPTPRPPQPTPPPPQPRSSPPEPRVAPEEPSLPPQVARYIRMLKSPNSRSKREAAISVYRSSYRSHRAILQTVNDELLRGYTVKANDRYHVDAMAWLCNILGVSRNRTYAATLDKVAAEAPNKKLKKYARKNHARLR